MKFSKLNIIVTNYAKNQKECAAYNGAWNDGGSGATLSRLSDYKDSIVRKEDFRPSEFHKLNEVEVGEPEEFSKEINEYKISLAKNINL